MYMLSQSACVAKFCEPYHLEEGEVVTRFPYVNLRKDNLCSIQLITCSTMLQLCFAWGILAQLYSNVFIMM